MRLFRAVDAKEHADVVLHGCLRPGPPSFQGKWLAENVNDAWTWGHGIPQASTFFHVIEVEVDDAFAQTLHRDPKLDTIGPARFVDIPDLPRVRIVGVVGSFP